MVMCGCHRQGLTLDPITPKDIGFIPKVAGFGILTITGDGLLFIMVAGPLITITDGCGFRDMIGLRLGLPGEVMAETMDGLP